MCADRESLHGVASVAAGAICSLRLHHSLHRLGAESVQNRCRIFGTKTKKLKRFSYLARWRSGYAEDCKSLHAGSIPARASTSPENAFVFKYLRGILSNRLENRDPISSNVQTGWEGCRCTLECIPPPRDPNSCP